ncbi:MULTISPECIES: amidohydrolase family protein [unclassified Carboxylicivirga]|uniref:amidohydrolase family protein n=1 Tax=Carboxylicivirga TaxID=1628153 RepID=UPI003D32A167
MKNDCYTPGDFDAVKKIDAHLHYYTDNPAYLSAAQECNMHLVSINVDFREQGWMPLSEQEKLSARHRQGKPGAFSYIGGIPLDITLQPDSIQGTIPNIDREIKQGAIGVKLWKNVGMRMTYKDNLVMIDHPIFTPLLDHLTQHQVPLLGHFGEPRNCWLPLEEMTLHSDRQYYATHPEFHNYQQTHQPGYQQHIDACNQMLARHPQLRYVGAHLASSEYDINIIAQRLDAHPNMMMDLAERVCHLQYQAATQHRAVYDFMVKYQDRLIYGSDMIFTDTQGKDEQLAEVKRRWHSQWCFFTQNDKQQTPEIEPSFKGLGLPRGVVDKIYYHNALKAYPSLAQQVK